MGFSSKYANVFGRRILKIFPLKNNDQVLKDSNTIKESLRNQIITLWAQNVSSFWISPPFCRRAVEQFKFCDRFGSAAIENVEEALPLLCLKDESGIDKIIVKKQPHQLLDTNREFFPSFDASNFHKLVNKSS